MNEIDDFYKQDTETLDTNYLENVKGKESREKKLNKYLKDLHDIRNKYEKRYVKHLNKERKKIWKKKKKRVKKAKLKYLSVKHFNFSFNSFQILSMRIKIRFFLIKRILIRFFVRVTPRFLIYAYYKTLRESKSEKLNVTEYVGKKKKGFNNKIEKLFIILMNKFKNIYIKASKIYKEIFGKNIPLKKKDGEGEKKEKEDESKEEKK